MTRQTVHAYNHSMNQLRPTIISFLRPGSVFTMGTTIILRAGDKPIRADGRTKTRSMGERASIDTRVSSNTTSQPTSNPTGGTESNALPTTFSTSRRTNPHSADRGTQVGH